MKTGFHYNEADDTKRSKVYFEQIFAEKPKGGIVANPAFDVEASTAVGVGADGLFVPIKCYKLVAAVGSSDTSIRIAKGSGIVKNDIIGTGAKAVKCTNVNTSNEGYDVVTVTLGVQLANGTTLYQAKAESAEAAEPILKPVFVTGNEVEAGKGDQRVRLINGANLRKETACVAEEVAALMPTIALV